LKKLSSASIFFPAYYDEQNIHFVVKDADELLKNISKKYEIIIINDGSPDNTGKVAENLKTIYPNLKVIHHNENKGYGATLKTGFLNSQFDYVLYSDGDNQYNIREFTRFLPFLENSDVVAGYVIEKALSNKRKLQSIIFNNLIWILFFIKFKDINCSMKVFKSKVLDSIEIKSDSAFIDAEIIIKLKNKGFPISQVNVTHKPRLKGVAGGSKLNVIIPTVIDMIKLKFGIL